MTIAVHGFPNDDKTGPADMTRKVHYFSNDDKTGPLKV
jgi:hypothetical protein